MEIQWMENEKRGRKTKLSAGTEVVVSVANKGSRKNTKFAFYNDSDQKISHSGYMVCGVSSNRIYFKEEYLQRGYKIQRISKNGTPFIIVKAVLDQFVGEYKLHLDTPRDLWYIEREEQ